MQIIFVSAYQIHRHCHAIIDHVHEYCHDQSVFDTDIAKQQRHGKDDHHAKQVVL